MISSVTPSFSNIPSFSNTKGTTYSQLSGVNLPSPAFSDAGQQEKVFSFGVSAGTEYLPESKPQESQSTYQHLDPLSGNRSNQPLRSITSQKDGDISLGSASDPKSLNKANSDPAEQAKLELIQDQISQLAARDREVRAHEQAHVAVGGPYAGAASYTYQRGPDGVNYAVGGEVSIDVSPAATPEQTIEKARVVKRAALAPAEPSSQDRKVAQLASALEQQAVIDLQQQEQSEITGGVDNVADSDDQTVMPSSIENLNSQVSQGIHKNAPDSSHSPRPDTTTSHASSIALNIFSELEPEKLLGSQSTLIGLA